MGSGIGEEGYFGKKRNLEGRFGKKGGKFFPNWKGWEGTFFTIIPKKEVARITIKRSWGP